MSKQIANGNWETFIKPPGMKDPDRFPRKNTSEQIPLVAGD